MQLMVSHSYLRVVICVGQSGSQGFFPIPRGVAPLRNANPVSGHDRLDQGGFIFLLPSITFTACTLGEILLLDCLQELSVLPGGIK